MGPEKAIIVAMDEERGIGRNGQLPWHIPEDLQHFKKVTTPHPVIMGRVTFESIGKPLPNRVNIVVSRNPNFELPNIVVRRSLEEALTTAENFDREKIFVIGGAQIFKESLELVDRLYLTLIKGRHQADTFFPEYKHLFQVVSEATQNTPKNELTFQELLRK